MKKPNRVGGMHKSSIFLLGAILARRLRGGTTYAVGGQRTEVLLFQLDLLGPVRSPLVLISQISRSGGTFLSQLFDGHPQVWAHPGELKIGNPRKWHWPNLSGVSDPRQAFLTVADSKRDRRYENGIYAKGGEGDALPILFETQALEALFLRACDQLGAQCERDWLDAYFTSFFHAWLDCQNRYMPKKFVVGFASMLAIVEDSVRSFARVYPDGYLVSVLREPVGWYASVKQRALDQPEKSIRIDVEGVRPYAGFEAAEHAYLANAEAIRRNASLLGERFLLIDYGELVKETERTMRRVATHIGLDWHPCLTRQTFNGMDIRPNTSFRGDRSSVLTLEDITRIEEGPMMAAYRSLR